jgi:two-component system sensor histidine kinase BaeS
LFITLAAQALATAIVPGGLLLWDVSRGFDRQQADRDREALGQFAVLAGEAARAGRPLAPLVAALDARDDRLGHRLALVRPDGKPIAGAPVTLAAPLPEEPVLLNGRTVARVRIVAPHQVNTEDRSWLLGQYLGVIGIMTGLLGLLLLAAWQFARYWSEPQRALWRLGREIAEGDHAVPDELPAIPGAIPNETLPVETAATMRNLTRIARQFNRIEGARRTWMASIADELKRPAATLGQRLEQLAGPGNKVEPELMAALEDNHRELAQMAEDLNAVALADLGRLPVNFTEVDVRALIHNALWASSAHAKALGVTLEALDIPDHTILVKWDSPRIEQLFHALIENSLRYTPRNGRILLGMAEARDAWRLTVDDSAPGVDVMLAQQLFDPFYRNVDRAGRMRSTSGLGLATARAIVDAHHGRIESSRSPLGGLRITVVLPASPPFT